MIEEEADEEVRDADSSVLPSVWSIMKCRLRLRPNLCEVAWRQGRCGNPSQTLNEEGRRTKAYEARRLVHQYKGEEVGRPA